VKSLIEHDIFDHDHGSFVFLDRFLRLWIQRQQIDKQKRVMFNSPLWIGEPSGWNMVCLKEGVMKSNTRSICSAQTKDKRMFIAYSRPNWYNRREFYRNCVITEVVRHCIGRQKSRQ
jgi:hypothetical protein